MKSVALRIVVSLLAGAVVTSTADAQRRHSRKGHAGTASVGPGVGAHVGYNFDAQVAVIGAQASFPVAQQVDFYPSFDYYASDATTWAFNFDARLRPPAPNRGGYLGAGLNLTYASAGGSSDTQTNVNLLGGLEGQRGRIRPFAEARLTVGHGSTFQIQGGVTFPLH